MRKLVTGAIVGAGAIWAGREMLRSLRRFSFTGKSVVITGGSRGLGLVLARQLVDAGARVAICARTQADLDAAVDELRQRGGTILSRVCDVSDRSQVQCLMSEVQQNFGRIDALFNVAGIIEVGPLDAMTPEDFRYAMETNCWGALNTVLEALSLMREQGCGRIVNVASLGGKRAVPHMLPYCVSKFALVGLSNGLRAELAKENILVTTVCPSLMRTGSPRNALFKGQHRKEYTWFSVGDSLPLISMSAEDAARQILRACRNGDAEVIIRHPANLGILLQSAFPNLTQEFLALVHGLLPEMGGIGRKAARGYNSHSEWSPSWLTQLGDEAAVRNNEMRQHPIPN